MSKKFMDKIKYAVAMISILLFCVAVPSSIYAKNVIHNIDMDITLKDNGSATVIERWSGDFDEGTEVYKPIDDRSLRISNFDVAKDGIDFIELESWDTEASFDEKSFRYGINRTEKGVELCFGISTYGSNTYAFSYDIDPVVKSYDDYDGFNFQFVNPSMSTFPTSINITLHHADTEKIFTRESTRIWAFGFEGNATVESNFAHVFSVIPLEGKNFANIMMRFNKGLFTPNIDVDGSFVDLVEDVAMEDSAYEEALENAEQNSEATAFYYIHMIILALVFIFAFFMPVILFIIRRNALKKFYNDSNYFRDTPNHGDIAVTYVLARDFSIWNNKKSNFLGALIVKMINDKNLIPVQEKSYGFLGKEKIDTNLKVGTEPSDQIARELYYIILKAAGSDGILQENELKKYLHHNPQVLIDFINSMDGRGHTALNMKDCYNKVGGNKLKDLTDAGKNELAEVYGSRKFLDEFTLISERSILEGVIWENLLVYATLFGLADKVLSELKRVYPDKIIDLDDYEKTVIISTAYYSAMYNSSPLIRKSLDAARYAVMAAEGFGGATSIDGGGGFSGGGGGGGTR